MSNFTFIEEKFPQVYAAAREAEETVYKKPINSGMFCRQAMELLLKWVYYIDVEFEQPYNSTIAAMLRTDTFQRDVPEDIIRELEFIRKMGNNATHTRKTNSKETVVALKHLFRWTQFVVKTYTEIKPPATFDASVIKIGGIAPKKEKSVELQHQRIQIDRQNEELARLRRQLEESEAEKERLRAEQEVYAKLKQENKHLPTPEPIVSEAETRRLFIDADLKAAGWDLDDERAIEYELTNFPKHINPSGKGYVDYVLWGDNGLPIGIVEAKRTCEEVKKGKNQAKVYADCVEKEYGQRPIIFYTNGHVRWYWDDTFSNPRAVHGYYTKDELQLEIDRRKDRADIRTFRPNENITNRYYQKEAIKRVFETFVTSDKDGLIQNGRRALIVMATGTGKTRTAISVVDLMMQGNWAKKVLFLADRNPLINQAKTNFNTLLPETTAINLGQERENKTTRLVFSTYQTMINRIDNGRTDEGDPFGVGHFDLIIVDEAHRSIYNRYQEIFDYFDGYIVGLTATPREEADRDTYEFFNCEEGNPTYYYELDQAVKDKFLRPPKKWPLQTQFLERGLRYSELSDSDKLKYEEAFARYGEEMPEEINAAAINKWLFNKPTVISIIDELMSKGIHVQSGELLGKTIIFAQNQKHADFIEEIFAEQYPEYKGKFTNVITYKDKYAQDSIDQFKKKEQLPQIAISVDMLDTGIDVPEIVNLVFFKPVYSKTKFWQMIGRGTRLCPDLFGPGEDKEDFLIFDCCNNFEYFEMNPDGRTSGSIKSISHRIFEIRLLLAEALRVSTEDTAKDYRNELLAISHQAVVELYNNRESQFRVKMRMGIIERYAQKEPWYQLDPIAVGELSSQIGPLIAIEGSDEKAKLFDNMMYQMELYLITGNTQFERGKENLIQRSRILEGLSNINAVKSKLELIRRIQRDDFWNNISVPTLEHIRGELRDLMQLIRGAEQKIVYTNISDVTIPTFSEPQDVTLPTTPQNYLDRVKSYIRAQKDHLVIDKLNRNIPITPSELIQLEEFLFDGGERGTKDQFVKAVGNDQPLGTFIRSIIGLDRTAALVAFSDFINKGNLNANQQKFIELIINHFEQEGVIDPKQLFEGMYKVNHGGLSKVFGDKKGQQIVGIIRSINDGAEVA